MPVFRVTKYRNITLSKTYEADNWQEAMDRGREDIKGKGWETDNYPAIEEIIDAEETQ